MEPKVITPDISIVVGDRVQSHDFPERLIYEDREPCYVEGVVTAIEESIFGGYKRYVIAVEKQVWCGVEEPPKQALVYAPVNGTQTTFGGETFGVVKVTK